MRVLDALNLISGDSLTGSLSVIDICQMYVLIYYFFFFPGASDPYTAIRIGNSKSPAKTRVINRSLAPRWNESFEIGFPLDGAGMLPKLCHLPSPARFRSSHIRSI